MHGALALSEVTPTVSSIPVQTEKKKHKKKTMIRH